MKHSTEEQEARDELVDPAGEHVEPGLAFACADLAVRSGVLLCR